MEVVVDGKALKRAHKKLKPFITKSSSCPVYEAVWVEPSADDERLRLFCIAPNEMYYAVEIPANVVCKGRAVIDLRDVDIPDGEVILKTDDKSAKIISGRTERMCPQLIWMEDAPASIAEAYSAANATAVPAERLAETMSRVLFCLDEKAPSNVAKVISVEAGDGCMRAVGCDGYRLAISEMEAPADFDGDFLADGDFIRKWINTKPKGLSTLMVGDRYVTITVSKDSTLVLRKSDFSYIKYRDLIPKEAAKSRVLIDKNELIPFIKDNEKSLMRKVGKQETKEPLRLVIGDGKIDVRAVSAYVDASTTITATTEGEELKIAFNPRYLREALENFPTDDVALNLISSKHPMFICNPTDESMFEILLPVFVRDWEKKENENV